MSQGKADDNGGYEFSDPELERLLKAAERTLQPKVAAINGEDEEVLAANKRYIGSHETLPADYQALAKEELIRMGKELLDRSTSIGRKETVLMVLALCTSYNYYRIKTYGGLIVQCARFVPTLGRLGATAVLDRRASHHHRSGTSYSKLAG